MKSAALHDLLRLFDVYCASTGMSRARLSTLVLNRGSTADAIAEGSADVTTGTFEKAIRWFSDHWPVDAIWPADLSRPSLEGACRTSPAGSEQSDPAFSSEAAA